MANRMKKSLIVVRMLLIVCLVGCIEAMYAQNNPYKIDDELYGYYAKAFRQRTNPEGLLMADTLLRMAEAKGDGKAVCMALTIPINYYFAKRDAEHVAEAVARCKEASRKYNFMQYYYHAYTMEINTLLNIGRQRAAFAMAEEMRRESVENGDHYGFFCCLRMMGNLYYARGDYHKAAAVEALKESCQGQTRPVHIRLRYLHLLIVLCRIEYFQSELLYDLAQLDAVRLFTHSGPPLSLPPLSA